MKDLKHRPRGRHAALAFLFVAALTATLTAAGPAPATDGAAPVAANWTALKFAQGQPACTGAGFAGSVYYDKLDCGFGYVQVSDTSTVAPNQSVVKFSFIDSSGVTRLTQTAIARAAENAWQYNITPAASWTPGPVTIRVTQVDPDGLGPAPNQVGNFGEMTLTLNALGATLGALPGSYHPGDQVPVSGTVYELDQVPPLAAPQTRGVGATFWLRLVAPGGVVRGPYGPYTADATGHFDATLPSAATEGLTADASKNFEISSAIEVVQSVYSDPLTGGWFADRAGATPLTMRVPASSLTIENSFVSEVGWVKPGSSYPFRVSVKNFTNSSAANAQVTIPAVTGMEFVSATPVTGSGTATASPTLITWTIGSVPARTDVGPGLKMLVVEARAKTLGQDAQVVWKNLSTTASLTYTGGPTLTATSHGPKVIPPKETFNTARYGDRPFPVVPVDWFDRKHEANHTGDRLADVINAPGFDGSTFNLYQEMSYGQLFPHGGVPSEGVATRGWEYGPGFDFSSLQPQGFCAGITYKDFKGTPVYPERIKNGWYQLPGDTAYYGSDRYGSAIPGAVVPGAAALQDIDSGCGPTGKAVYDAAQAADPEIDYSDYDTDKNGVVDFFMMVFVGEGGHGGSQTSVPPYDNIWPHSGSLESAYTDSATGLKGYISDDQLRDNHGRLLYYVDDTYSTMTTDTTDYPVYVRVGPYNVNPESAIDKASVISHEYGHSLGLPDYYSVGGRSTYGDWNLMATDKSQNMDVNAKQELGWLVPRVLAPGTTTVNGWVDSKVNTHQIDWKQPNGTAYTLTGPSVNNGQAYVAKLPARQIIDPAEVPSGGHVWWSRSGNGFGCTPQGAHNLDINLPELATLPAGTPVTVSFKSKWDIEWDYDYGFVLYSTDGGSTYTSLASANGYTTPGAQNPTANACQTQYGNGITGTSGSYQAGTQTVDRATGEYPAAPFLDDSFDLSAAVGHSTVLRFSYATDPGLARPGWFIDDIRITAGDEELYESDFETSGDPDDLRIYNGGCKETTRVADRCTGGWQYVLASEDSPADHAYYLEMRDRSGFDFDSKNQNDRDPVQFQPGVLLTYTDEAHGYGNYGTDDPPAQSPLDSLPQPGSSTPTLNDAAWTDVSGDNTFSDSGAGWTDNYVDPANDEVDSRYPSVAHPWRFQFGCLAFQVLSMTGKDAAPAYNLRGDARFTTGSGCAQYDYGMNSVANAAPTAVAQARPMTALVFEPVELDGSGSFDDRQPSSELAYAWDLDGNGSFETPGATATMFYASAGTYVATLRVTDGGGLSDTDTVSVTVVASDPSTTGGKTHGSGWIPGGGNQHRANFSFEAKNDRNRISGKVKYSYGGTGISMKGGVAALTISGTTAQFSGPCNYGGGACTYVANVEDNGGDQSVGVDRFTIRVYSPGGALIHQNSGLLGGGKLHVHPPS